jgi:acyl carrier protein
MQTEDIVRQVRTFITENYLLGQDHPFAESDSFLEQGIIDSTGVLELVAFIQETYGIAVEDEELTPENLDSLTSVTAYITRKLQPAAEAAAVKKASQGGL